MDKHLITLIIFQSLTKNKNMNDIHKISINKHEVFYFVHNNKNFPQFKYLIKINRMKMVRLKSNNKIFKFQTLATR